MIKSLARSPLQAKGAKVVLIALATGMRRGEVLALRWGGVDFERGLVRVAESLEETRPTKGKATLRFKSTKTGKARVVTLPRFALDELRRHKREQAEQLLALGVRQSAETLVCPREDGEPMVPESLTREFTRLAARVPELPWVKFHELHHALIFRRGPEGTVAYPPTENIIGRRNFSFGVAKPYRSPSRERGGAGWELEFTSVIAVKTARVPAAASTICWNASWGSISCSRTFTVFPPGET